MSATLRTARDGTLTADGIVDAVVDRVLDLVGADLGWPERDRIKYDGGLLAEIRGDLEGVLEVTLEDRKDREIQEAKHDRLEQIKGIESGKAQAVWLALEDQYGETGARIAERIRKEVV